MTLAVIYARVSTEDQAGPDKASIPAQLADCRLLAAKLGWQIVGEYVEDKKYKSSGRIVEPSGKNADRPQWRAMLAELASGRADALLAWSTSRLYRAYTPMAEFLEILDKHPIQVQLVNETFNQEFAIFPAWLAKRDNSDRVDRMMMGKAAVARRGLHPTRHSPFYRTLRDEDGHRIGCELRAEYRPFLDRLAELFLARQSYESIAQALQTNPATGKRMSNNSVRQIIRNPWYQGRIVHGGRARKTNTQHFTAQGLQPPAWDAETCAAIETELARRASVGRRVAHGKGGGLFSGVARCGYCGRVLTAYHVHNGKYLNYACAMAYKWQPGWPPTRGLPHPGNNISERNLLALLQELMDAVEDDEVEPLLLSVPRRPSVDPAELARARAALSALATEFDGLPVTALRSRALLAGEIERARDAAASLEASATAAEPIEPDMGQLLARVAELRQAFDTQLPMLELRAKLAQAFPGLHIKAGELCLPPDV